MSPSVLDRVQQLLTDKSVAFNLLHHEPVYTSEEAARVRGTPLASGAKALVCKADERFLMFVLPADRRLDSKAARRQLGLSSLRFASKEEVLELTGLTPGSIPPFGSLFGLETLCDDRLAENARINFNAGDHAVSISLPYAEYLRAEQPRLGQFAAAPE